MERFLNRRLRSEEARPAYQEAEDAFRNKLDDASGVHGIWQGEFWGKWIIGAVRTAEYFDDGELREFIRQGCTDCSRCRNPPATSAPTATR
ncbi:MAG: hypothetical protein L6W00_06535 [Lentisphaeria bacterium]|nr:MAG: hypothetical protein L6W00_06535 [Lentisphaeria bacterium]